jgi:hypothetical protein
MVPLPPGALGAPDLDDLELPHHPAILVLQVVAMEHVAAPEVGEVGDDPHRLPGAYRHGVFPGRLLRR